MKYFVIRR